MGALLRAKTPFSLYIEASGPEACETKRTNSGEAFCLSCQVPDEGKVGLSTRVPASKRAICPDWRQTTRADSGLLYNCVTKLETF